MLSIRQPSGFSLKHFRLGVVLLALPLMLGLILQSFGTAQARAAGSIQLDKNSGPTGGYITITGTNMTNCLETGICTIFIYQGDQFLEIGEVPVDANDNFTWTGALPRAGQFNQGEEIDGTVAKGNHTIAVGDNPYQPSTLFGSDFNVTDNSQGPYVSWNAQQQSLARWYHSEIVIVNKLVSRSWLWGPKLLYAGYEPYKDSPNGWRYVEYFDKARMEVNDYNNDPENNPYYVSNGLLVKEMVTNQIQLGDNTFQDNTGAPDVLPAGDLTSANQTPPYRVYKDFLDTNDNSDGDLVNEYLSRTGDVQAMDTYNKYNVTVGHKVDQTGHYIASPFWAYLNTTGLVQDLYGQPRNARLFDPLFSATGLPITEPYWTTTMVGGVNKDVLVQLFERRVLTYTPSNSPAYQVEMRNVALQYFQWRNGH